MNRGPLLAAGLLLLGLLGPTSHAQSAQEWPMFRYDETHQGNSNTNTEFTTFKQEWWRNVSIPAPIKGSPVVKDGRVFVGAWDNNVYALDAESGNVLWRNATNGKITGSPAVSQTTVYVATEGGSLYAFNAGNGALERQVALGSPTFGSPVVHERRVFIGTNMGTVSAYEGDTLSLVWTFPTASATGTNGKYFNQTIEVGGEIRGSPVVFNGQVMFGSSNQWFYAVSEQGSGNQKTNLIWMFKAGGAILSTAAIDKNPSGARVLFGAQDGKLYSISLAGASGYVQSTAWTYQETGFGLFSQIQSSCAIVAGKCIFGANSGNITAVSLSSGSRQWVVGTGGAVVSSPAVANGFVITGSNDGKIYMLKADDGSTVWTKQASAAIEASPAIAGTQAFWASTDGALYSWGGTKPSRADLSITQVSGSLVRSLPSTVVVVVKNEGALTAPATNIQFFQTNALLGTATVPSLNASAQTTVTFTFTPAVSSFLSLRVVVDPTNEIREYDESNNVKTTQLAIGEPPPPQEQTSGSPSKKGPGFDGLLALAAVGAVVALLLARRRRTQ